MINGGWGLRKGLGMEKKKKPCPKMERNGWEGTINPMANVLAFLIYLNQA